MVASLCAFGVALLAVPIVAGELAAARERRALEGQLAAEREGRAAEKGRADAAERRLAAVVAAHRDYVAALPDGPLDDAAARRLLELTERAAGAAGPPPEGEGDGDRALGEPG